MGKRNCVPHHTALAGESGCSFEIGAKHLGEETCSGIKGNATKLSSHLTVKGGVAGGGGDDEELGICILVCGMESKSLSLKRGPAARYCHQNENRPPLWSHL